jgi:hypothetical protein
MVFSLKSSCGKVPVNLQFASRDFFMDHWAIPEPEGKLTVCSNSPSNRGRNQKISAEVLTPVKTLDEREPLQERRAGMIAGQTAGRNL